MKFLELFSGTHVMADTFKRAGWETYTVDWDPATDVDLHTDIGKMTLVDILSLCGNIPDVIWASPDCTTYSVAAISRHRRCTEWSLIPVSDYAKACDAVNINVLKLIKLCVALGKESGRPVYYFIENPRGALRKMQWMQGLPRYTVTYCQYGETRQKPTDIWTNHPDPQFKPPCKAGAPCHVRAPRGSKTGTQGINGKLNRARIPQQLCDHIVEICQEMEG